MGSSICLNCSTPACTIAELQQQLADAKAIIAKHDLCHDLHGKVGQAEFEEGCRREAVKEFGSCGWAQQLADARLLARAMMTHEIYRVNNQLVIQDCETMHQDCYACNFDEHGLPILTDEVRAALRKAVGE